MNKRIEAIRRELATMDIVNNCSYNNDGLYNEMRILKEKLEKELKQLLEEQENES